MYIGNDEVFQAAAKVLTKLSTLECMPPEYFFTSLVIFYYLETTFHTFDDVRVVGVGDRLKSGK